MCPCPPRDLSCSSSILIVYSFKTSFGRSNKYFIGGISYLRNPFNNHSCCDAAFFKNFFFHEWIEFSKKIKSKIQSKNHSAPFNIIVEDDRCLNNSIESSLLIKTSHEFCWTRSRSLWIILKSSFCQRHDWVEHDLREYWRNTYISKRWILNQRRVVVGHYEKIRGGRKFWSVFCKGNGCSTHTIGIVLKNWEEISACTSGQWLHD